MEAREPGGSLKTWQTLIRATTFKSDYVTINDYPFLVQ